MKPAENTSGGSTPRPRAADAPPDEQSLVPGAPRPPFVFFAHPTSWDVVLIDEKPVIVPNLCRLDYRAGRGGVRAVRGSPIGDPGPAKLDMKRRGWIEIPRSTGGKAFGEQFDDYVVGYNGSRGTIHVPVWERLQVLGNSVHVEHDTDVGFDAWRRDLVNKVVPGPNAAALNALRGRLQNMISRRSARANGSAQFTVELLRQKLKVFETTKGRAKAQGGE